MHCTKLGTSEKVTTKVANIGNHFTVMEYLTHIILTKLWHYNHTMDIDVTLLKGRPHTFEHISFETKKYKFIVNLC